MEVRIKFGKYGTGNTDGIATYCCSAIPCYFVEFPCGYSGYFNVSDCEVLND